MKFFARKAEVTSLLAALPRGDPDRPPTDHRTPTAMFAPTQKIAEAENLSFADGKIFLGVVGGTVANRATPSGRSETFVTDGVPIGIGDDRHMVTVAGSRSGKGRGVIVPNMLLYPGSVLATDPKGELASITARRRSGMGQAVHILDPFGLTGQDLARYRAGFNPLAGLDAGDPGVVAEAATIADALVVVGGTDPHWDESARAFIEGLILHVISSDAYQGKRTLAQVRLLSTRGAEDVGELYRGWSMTRLEQEMRENDSVFGLVQAAAADFFDRDKRERDSVLSTVRRHLKFLDLPEMKGVLEKHDFDLADLKRKRTTVYLCLPARHMGTCSRWLRLFVNLSLQAMERTRGTGAEPVLFCLDEFATLGHMRQVEDAAGQIAGFGVKLWPILQDLGQLKELYKGRWETFLGNAGILQFFGNNDLATLDWISRRLGKTSIRTSDASSVTAAQHREGARSESWRTEVHDLLTPEEVARFFSGADRMKRQLVIVPGMHALVLQRVWYDQHEMFRGMFDHGR